MPRVPLLSSLRTRILVLGGLFSAAIIGVVLITAYVVVATGMAEVADSTNLRAAERAFSVYQATRAQAEADARGMGLPVPAMLGVIQQRTLQQLPKLFAVDKGSDVQYQVYSPALERVWSSSAALAHVPSGTDAARKKAVQTGRLVSENTYSSTILSGLFSKANLGVFVTHVPLDLGGGNVGVMDVMYFPTREESVIDATRLPMAALAITAIALAVLMMNVALTGVLRLIDDLRVAADEVDADHLDVKLPDYGTHEIAELARSINHLVQRLRRRSDAQSRFVADASHELATPVAGIRGYVNILRDWGGEDPEIRTESIEAIDRESKRMVRLTGELLSLVRSERITDVRSESVDVNALIREVLASTATRYLDKGIEFAGPDEDIRFFTWTDPDRLEQILAILLDNAAKYTPPGGRVWAEAGVAGDDVLIKVCDTGQGIPDDQLPNIFDRFYRVDDSRSSAEGFGLGLAIAKRQIDAIGATVEVESETDQGTTFSLRLAGSAV